MNFLIYPKEGDRMKGSGKAGNGGNNRRRPAKRRDNQNRQGGSDTPNASGTPRNFGGDPQKARGRQHHENQNRQNRSGFHKKGGGELYRKEKPASFDRPKWVPPKISTEPLPVPDCPWCGKPIKDISLAMTDRESGAPVHFECVSARIAVGEVLEKGEVITYIGGGRFGIVYFSGSGNSHQVNRNFKIKKIVEWEDKDKRADWRSLISDRYSIT